MKHFKWRDAEKGDKRQVNLQEVAVDPGLVLEVIDWLEGVYRWNASIAEPKKQVPEVR